MIHEDAVLVALSISHLGIVIAKSALALTLGLNTIAIAIMFVGFAIVLSAVTRK